MSGMSLWLQLSFLFSFLFFFFLLFIHLIYKVFILIKRVKIYTCYYLSKADNWISFLRINKALLYCNVLNSPVFNAARGQFQFSKLVNRLLQTRCCLPVRIGPSCFQSHEFPLNTAGGQCWKQQSAHKKKNQQQKLKTRKLS